MTDIPALPPGFKLDEPTAAPAQPAIPALPPGFKLDQPQTISGAVRDAFDNAKLPSLTQAAPGAGDGGLTINVSPKGGAAGQEPSLVDHIMSAGKTAMGVADQTVRGAVGGAANVLGMPGDLGKMTGVSSLPAKSPVQFFGGMPFPTSDAIKAIPDTLNDWTAKMLGAEPPRRAPDGFAERLGHRVGEEIGAAAVPAGGAVAAGARMGIPAARAAIPEALGNRFVDFFRQAPAKLVESAAVDPSKFIRNEVTAATAAGTGAAAANYATGKDGAVAAGEPTTLTQDLGDVVGAFTGVGLYAGGRKAVEAGSHVLGALTGRTGTRNSVVRDVTTDEIARAAGVAPNKHGVIDTGPMAEEVANGKRVSDTIPGFQESTADRTKSPGLAAMEYSRQSGSENTGMYAARRTANTDAIDAAMSKNAPDGTPGALSSELQLERERRLSDAAVTRQNAEDAAADATRGLVPQGTPSSRGNTIGNDAVAANEAARAKTQKAYADANVGDKSVDPADLKARLDDVAKGLTETEKGLVPQGTIDRVTRLGAEKPGAPGQPAGAPDPVRLEEAISLQSELKAQQRAADALPNSAGANTSRVLGKYIDATNAHIAANLTPEEAAATAAAREARTSQGDAFGRKNDPVTGIVQQNGRGDRLMRDENIASAATQPTVMSRLLESVDTPATRDAIRNQLLSKADTSTAEGIQRFTQQHAEQLKHFPGLGDELTAATRARTTEAGARQSETGIIRQLGAADGTIPGRSTVGRYLQYGDENADKAMRAVMAHKDPAAAADELLRFVKDDPKAVDGARKVFWDIMQRDTRSGGSTTQTLNGKQPYLPGRLKDFLEDPAKATVADRLYRDNPEHLADIRKISEAMQGVDVRNAAKAPNTSGTAQGVNQSYLPTMETLSSRIFAVERGVVSPAFAAINIAGIIARKAVKQAHSGAVNKAIDLALLNPDFAADLLKTNNPANRAALARSAKGYLGNEMSTILKVLNQGDAEDPDAEIKRAVAK